MIPQKPHSILFTFPASCPSGNEGEYTFDPFGAPGSFPKGAIHPFALALLKQLGLPTDGLRSKSWDEFVTAPPMDFIFTVCDNAAGEICPVWPGRPVTAHWGMPDPAAAEGSEGEKMQAFRDCLRMLSNRIRVFAELPFEKLDRLKLKAQLDDIGRNTQ